MTDAFVARPSPVRLALLLLLGVGLVILGAWIAGIFGPAPRPGREWVGWIATAFFGLCAAVAARRLFDRGPEIVIDAGGLYLRRWSEAKIPWEAVRGVDYRSMSGQRFACLHLRDPDRFPPQRTLARIATLNKRIGFGDIALSTVGTDRRFDELVGAIERYGRGSGPIIVGGPEIRTATKA